MGFTKAMYGTITTILLGALMSCGNVDQLSNSENSFVEYPSIPPSSTGLPTVRPTTKVLTKFAQQTIKTFSADGTIVIDIQNQAPLRAKGELGTMKIDEVAELTAGVIIISPPTENAPYGLLRKVESVTENTNGTATIETKQASLAEAIAGSDLKPEDIKQSKFTVPVEISMVAVPKDVSAIPSSLPTKLTPEKATKFSPRWDFFPVEAGICNPSPPISLPVGTVGRTACIQMKLWLTVNIDIGWWWIFPYLKGFGAWENGWAQVQSNIDINLVNIAPPDDKPYTINLPSVKQVFYDNTVGVSVFWVGPIPVVINPKIILEGGLQGKLTVSGNVGLSVNSLVPGLQFNLGTKDSPLQYGFYCGNTVTNGNWGCQAVNNTAEKIEMLSKQLSNWGKNTNSLQVSANASVSAKLAYNAYISLEAGIYLYGVVGLAARFKPYVGPEITAQVTYNNQASNNPRTQITGGLYAGIDGDIVAGISLLGFNLQTTIVEGVLVPKKPIIDEFSNCWIGFNFANCP